MMRRMLRLVVLTLLAAVSPAMAGTADFNLGLGLPPVIVDTKAPPACTVTWLLDNTANNDVFAVRMRVEPDQNDIPVGGRMPCPSAIPPRVADRALDVCTNLVTDPKTCVYADMVRGFEAHPEVRNTAENASRCLSDKAREIALACWMAGGLAVCNVGCGDTSEAAEQSARARCEDKQQHSCPVTASVPVLAP